MAKFIYKIFSKAGDVYVAHSVEEVNTITYKLGQNFGNICKIPTERPKKGEGLKRPGKVAYIMVMLPKEAKRNVKERCKLLGFPTMASYLKFLLLADRDHNLIGNYLTLGYVKKIPEVTWEGTIMPNETKK